MKIPEKKTKQTKKTQNITSKYYLCYRIHKICNNIIINIFGIYEIVLN